MDQSIKRTLTLAFVVVVLAKVVSGAYDAFFVDSQVEAREAAQAMKNTRLREEQEMNAARNAERRGRKCAEITQSQQCTAARHDADVSSCLRKLRHESCDRMPRIHLCGAVERLEKCADPFADQGHNGCERLRRSAHCSEKPAPATLDGLWEIGLHDGMWDGD